MLISLAEVREKVSLTPGNRTFVAKIKSLADGEKIVNYTTQYASGGEGIVNTPIPEIGTTVMVCQPDGCGEWYYMCSTFNNTPYETQEGGAEGTNQGDPVDVDAQDQIIPSINSAIESQGTGTEDSFVNQTRRGSGLRLNDSISSRGQCIGAQIYSGAGKIIALEDGPGLDHIMLCTGNNSKITLTNNPQNSDEPDRAVIVESAGPQKYINEEDQTDVVVLDGRELQLLNNSTSVNAPGAMGTPEYNYAGNVNIQSKYNDVNVFSKQPFLQHRLDEGHASDGRIFIECLNTSGYHQVIQIQTHGAGADINDDDILENSTVIRIKSSGKVEIISEHDIDIKSNANINMQAASDINLTAGGEVKIKANSGDVAVQGGPNIQLNPDGGVSPTPPNIGTDSPHYSAGTVEDGINTY